MGNKDLDKLMEIIDSIKMYSGRDEVKIVGNSKSFEELTAMGFPLTDFKCEEVNDELDESKIYIIPIDTKRKDNLCLRILEDA